jgi:hypothetical protein
LPVTVCFGSIAWSFVFVGPPLHIQRVGPPACSVAVEALQIGLACGPLVRAREGGTRG